MPNRFGIVVKPNKPDAIRLAKQTPGKQVRADAVAALGVRFRIPTLRRGGLALTLASYFAAHLLALPMDPTFALAFLVLGFVGVELRLVAERFAALYTANLSAEDRARIGEALRRSLTRIGEVCVLALLVSYLVADLALAGTIPTTTIPAALILSAALVGVVVLLALWPVVGRSQSRSA